MRRPLLYSVALHAVIALIVQAATSVSRPPARESARAAELALEAAPPPLPAVVDVDVLAHAGGGGPARRAEPAVAAPARTRRRPAATGATTATSPAPSPEPSPEPAPSAAQVPSPSDLGSVEVAQGAPAQAAPAAPGDEGAEAGDGDGTGAGNGLGDGFGDGFGAGGGGASMSRELHARVLGDEVVDVRAREGVPIIAHDEATTLRTRDTFPRLPESVWPGGRPYIVKLEICVAEDGRVDEAVLRSSASARLDPVVRAAARTWRYRPRLVDGKPAPFCHGVVIKYERW